MVPEHDADPAAEPAAAPEWLTIAQVARRLGCSERAVRKHIERGRLEVRRERSGNQVRTLQIRVPGAVQAVEHGADRAAGPVADLGRNWSPSSGPGWRTSRTR